MYGTVAIGYALLSIGDVSELAQKVGRNCLSKMHRMHLLFIILQKARRIISHRTGKNMFAACLLSRRLVLITCTKIQPALRCVAMYVHQSQVNHV